MTTEQKAGYTWRESFDMCSMKCKHWSHDMDDAFCTHPVAMQISNGWGAGLNRMIREGHCTGCNDDPAKNQRQLFEAR